MDAAKRQKLQERMAKQYKQYAFNLPARLLEVSGLWIRLLESPSDMELISTLHREVHTLAGSGATFGFPKMGSVARVTEGLLKTVLDKKQTFASQKNLIQLQLDLLQVHITKE